MYELWYHTPTRTYVQGNGTYDEMLIKAKQLAKQLKETLPKSEGYYFTIRLNGMALKRI